MSVTLALIVGRYFQLNSSAATGKFTFDLTYGISDGSVQNFPPWADSAVLDQNGGFALVLPSNEDNATLPQNTAYTVTPAVSGVVVNTPWTMVVPNTGLATLLTGSTAPSSGTGSNGNYYLDTTTNTVYGPKVSGNWTTWPPIVVTRLNGQTPAGVLDLATVLPATPPNPTFPYAPAANALLTGTTGIESFYVPNPTIPNIIMGPQPGSGDSAEISGLIQDIATGAGEGELVLPGTLYTAQSPIVMASNVNLRGPGTIQAGSSAPSGILECPSIDTVTDVEVAINLDGGFGVYGATVGMVSGLIASAATRVRYKGKITNFGDVGILFQLSSTQCGILDGTYFSGIGLYDGAGGNALIISDSNDCWATNPHIYLCNGYGIYGSNGSLGFKLLGGHFNKANGPTGTGVGTSWSGGDLEFTLTSTQPFPVTGTFSLAGVGVITYTGITANGGSSYTATGCSPSSGSYATNAVIRHGIENIGFTAGCNFWSLVGFASLNSGDNGISASGSDAFIRGTVNTCQYDGVYSGGNENNIDVIVENPGTCGAGLGFAGVHINNAVNNQVKGTVNDGRGASACMGYGIKESGTAAGGRYDARITGQTASTYLLVGGATSVVTAIGSAAQLTVSGSGLSASPDPTTGTLKTITFTTNNSVTINNPNNPFTGAILSFDFLNSSGGSLTGSVSFGTKYQLAGAITLPANGNRRTVTFQYESANSVWVETSRAAADIT